MKYIIYAPSFNEKSGGRIALHKLCDLLNNNGEDAFIWPYYYDIPKFNKKLIINSILRIVKHSIVRILSLYRTNKNFNTPIAKKDDLNNDSIVIYPEIVDGNPLGAKNVIRWFLHKPGFHTGKISYGENELYFFYQIIFNDNKINKFSDNLLTVTWVRDDIFKLTNEINNRTGSCYILRKGKGRKIQHDLENSILLDGKSNREIARQMNKSKYFISYDLETMYSHYAVLCGCISVVIPVSNISKKEWQPKEEYTYGIAYGFDDIKEAEKTKELVLDSMKNDELKSNELVKSFIQKSKKFFFK